MAAASTNKIAKPKSPPRADTRWFRITEKILYDYPALETAITTQEALIRSIDNNQLPSGTAKYGDYGPPTTGGDKLTETEAWAEKRLKSVSKVEARIRLLKARKAAVDAALERLDADSRRLVELWYFGNWAKRKKPGNRAVWKELGISRNTFVRRRKEIVEEVARWLGELTEVEV